MRLGINGHGVTGAYAILKRTVKIAAAANGCGTAPPRGKIVVFFFDGEFDSPDRRGGFLFFCEKSHEKDLSCTVV